MDAFKKWIGRPASAVCRSVQQNLPIGDITNSSVQMFNSIRGATLAVNKKPRTNAGALKRSRLQRATGALAFPVL
jgi:hypothetical protein